MSRPSGLWYICKICKNVYKEKSDLIDHKKSQHSQILESSFVRIKRGRDNSNTLEPVTERTNNCKEDLKNGLMKIVKVESIVNPFNDNKQFTPDGMQKKLTTNKIEREFNEWKKCTSLPGKMRYKNLEPEKGVGSTIISAKVAASTAACYKPTGIKLKQSGKSETIIFPMPGNFNKEPALPAKLKLKSNQRPNSSLHLQCKKSEFESISRVIPKLVKLGVEVKLVQPGNSGDTNGSGKVMQKSSLQIKPIGSQNKAHQVHPNCVQVLPMPKPVTHNQQANTSITPASSQSPTKCPPKLMRQPVLPPKVAKGLQSLHPPQLLRETSHNSPHKVAIGGRLPNSRGGRGRGRGRGRGAVSSKLAPVQIVRPTTTSTNDPLQPPVQRRGRGRPPKSIQRIGRGSSPILNQLSLSKLTSKPKLSNTSQPTTPAQEESGNTMPGQAYKCPSMDAVGSYISKKGIRIWICLVCRVPEEEVSGTPMICCETCDDWYHFNCVGITVAPPDEEPWFCKRCIHRNLHRIRSLS